jgi:hypothetical protein
MKLTSIFRVVSTLLPIMLVAAGCGSDEKPPPMSPSRPSGTQLPGCSSNKDCRFDRVCTAGKCVVPPLSEETKSKIGDGELTVPVVRAIVQTRSCAGLTLRAIHQKLADLDSRDARLPFAPELAEAGPFKEPRIAYGMWLAFVGQVASVCKDKSVLRELPDLVDGTAAYVPEEEVDEALEAMDCPTRSLVEMSGHRPRKDSREPASRIARGTLKACPRQPAASPIQTPPMPRRSRRPFKPCPIRALRRSLTASCTPSRDLPGLTPIRRPCSVASCTVRFAAATAVQADG